MGSGENKNKHRHSSTNSSEFRKKVNINFRFSLSSATTFGVQVLSQCAGHLKHIDQCLQFSFNICFAFVVFSAFLTFQPEKTHFYSNLVSKANCQSKAFLEDFPPFFLFGWFAFSLLDTRCNDPIHICICFSIAMLWLV